VLTRTDGVLFHLLDLPARSTKAPVGLKNMARIASFRKSVPQDGRLLVDGCEIPRRHRPSHFGEKVSCA